MSLSFALVDFQRVAPESSLARETVGKFASPNGQLKHPVGIRPLDDSSTMLFNGESACHTVPGQRRLTAHRTVY